MPEQNKALSEIEKANEAIIIAFNEAWSNRDTDTLLTLVADDVTWMVYDGGPVHAGRDEVEASARPFMAKYERIDFKILRMSVMGSVTMHERTEDYYAPGGEVDTHWHVTGLLVIKDGQIVIWRDYGIPGARQITGPMVRQK